MNKSKSYIDIQKENYYKIGTIRCKVLFDELVFFDNHGLNHILRKDNKPRSFSDQFRRFTLMKHCKKILHSKNVEVEKRVSEQGTNKACFWGITGTADGQKIKIIIRRINNSELIFFSIMNL